jgi:hypothetical protein
MAVTPNPLLGTWKLKSYVVTSASGARLTPYGECPTGYLSYSADGRMQVIGAADGRSVAGGALAPESERAALYDTMFAYGGTYSLETGTITHHVDIAWDPAWIGTDQRRRFELVGDTLTLSTRFTDPSSGAESHYVLVWVRLPQPP